MRICSQMKTEFQDQHGASDINDSILTADDTKSGVLCSNGSASASKTPAVHG